MAVLLQERKCVPCELIFENLKDFFITTDYRIYALTSGRVITKIGSRDTLLCVCNLNVRCP